MSARSTWKIEDGTFRLAFGHCTRWLMLGEDTSPFEVAGPDGRFVAAAFRINEK